jgi:putative endonuclease
MKRGGAAYIMTNATHSTLYTGVSSDLRGRVYKHKNHLYPGSFTDKYKISKLVYYESFWTIGEAIYREKQIKAGSRKKKIELIEKMKEHINFQFETQSLFSNDTDFDFEVR